MLANGQRFLTAASLHMLVGRVLFVIVLFLGATDVAGLENESNITITFTSTSTITTVLDSNQTTTETTQTVTATLNTTTTQTVTATTSYDPNSTLTSTTTATTWYDPNSTATMTETTTVTMTTTMTVTTGPEETGDVTGDPITYYGTVRRKFELPIGELTSMLRAPDMNILAMPFPGNDDAQFIDRLVVATADGEQVIQVTIKKNIAKFNSTRAPPNAFETIDVAMGPWASETLVVMPPRDAQYHHRSGIDIAFSRVRPGGPMGLTPQFETMIGEACREAVMVTSGWMKILILSTSAVEYYGYDSELAITNAHLDFMVLEMRDAGSFGGILPELWGLRPLTDKVRAMIDDEGNPSIIS